MPGYHYLLSIPFCPYLRKFLKWAVWRQCRETKAYTFQAPPDTLLRHDWLLVIEELTSGMKMLLPGHFFRISKNPEK